MIKHQNYLDLIKLYEKDIATLEIIFAKKIKNRFQASFLFNFVPWFNKDSKDSIFSNFFKKKENKSLFIFFVKDFIKFIIIFILFFILKLLSIFFYKKKKLFKYLLHIPRSNETFYESNINFDKKIKNSIEFSFIYKLSEIFYLKKKILFFIKYIPLHKIIYLSFSTINIFIKIYRIKKKNEFFKLAYLIDENHYNFTNIYSKLLNIDILENFLKIEKIKFIFSGSLPTSPESKIFNYLSRQMQIEHICLITKFMCKNNLGYKFIKNSNYYPNFYLINSLKNEKILYLNKYDSLNYYFFKYKKKNYIKIDENKKICILIVFTRNNNENIILFKIIKALKEKIDLKIFYKYHPQMVINQNISNFFEKEATNLTKLSNREIENYFKNKSNKKYALTTFSSYLGKIINLGFYPIWINGADIIIDFLFKDVKSNLGYQININLKKSFFYNSLVRFLKRKSHLKKKDTYFMSDYIKFNDFVQFVKKLDLNGRK